MLIDTHLHLDAEEFATDRLAVLERARAAGVSAFVLPAVTAASGEAVRALAAQHAGCRFACGIHPLFVEQAQEEDLQRLQAQLAAGGAVAVGEIGLDGFVPGADAARQEWFFAEQLRLARRFDLPVLLHVRRAQDRVLKYLRRHRVRGGIAHAFNGSAEQARAFIGLGFALGFGGAMTYPGSTRIRGLAATLPAEHLVLESDAPDIPPAWAPHARNEPASVARYCAELAALRGDTPQALAEQLADTVRRHLPGF